MRSHNGETSRGIVPLEEEEATGIDMLVQGFIADGHDALIGTTEAAQRDHIIAAGGCSIPARFDMIGLIPVVSVKQRDRVILFRDADHHAQTARRIAKIAMRAVKPQMPDARGIDPIDRMPVRDEQMIRRVRLRSDACDAALQLGALLLVIGCDDQRALSAGFHWVKRAA
jgi:hypothetical protein